MVRRNKFTNSLIILLLSVGAFSTLNEHPAAAAPTHNVIWNKKLSSNKTRFKLNKLVNGKYGYRLKHVKGHRYQLVKVHKLSSFKQNTFKIKRRAKIGDAIYDYITGFGGRGAWVWHNYLKQAASPSKKAATTPAPATSATPTSSSSSSASTSTSTSSSAATSVSSSSSSISSTSISYPFKTIERFDRQTTPPNFGFTAGASIENGQLLLGKALDGSNTGIKTFSPKIIKQPFVNVSFDWRPNNDSQTGLEFRDLYGRLIFALSSTANQQVRYATSGIQTDSSTTLYENHDLQPDWQTVTAKSKSPYHVNFTGNFESQTVGFTITDASHQVIAHGDHIPTIATNLTKLVTANYSKTQSQRGQLIDNFTLKGTQAISASPLEGKSVYAFGDSIVAGHKYLKAGFVNFAGTQEGMKVTKHAVNGSTIMPTPLEAMTDGYQVSQVISQVQRASKEAAPDYIVFDGGTNDARYVKDETYGTITDSNNKNPDTFDKNTYAGALENTIATMKATWPKSKLVFVAVHKMGSRNLDVQAKLHDIQLAAAHKWGISVADVYSNPQIDTTQEDQKSLYTFDSLDAAGLPLSGGASSGTHPNLVAIEKFYVPTLVQALEDAGN